MQKPMYLSCVDLGCEGNSQALDFDFFTLSGRPCYHGTTRDCSLTNTGQLSCSADGTVCFQGY